MVKLCAMLLIAQQVNNNINSDFLHIIQKTNHYSKTLAIQLTMPNENRYLHFYS